MKHFFSRLRVWWPWIFAAVFLTVNGWFVANLRNYPELRKVADRPEIAVVSVVFVLLFALPSFWSVLRWRGVVNGALLLLTLGLFAVLVETFALNTGWPYGRFEYGEKIGAKLPGGVPWTVCFAWTPLLLCAMPLAYQGVAHCVFTPWIESRPVSAARARSIERLRHCVWAAAILTAFDATLDPGAVSQSYWHYPKGGAFYGVPLSNFAGWLLSGFLGALIFSMLTRDEMPPRGVMSGGLLILIFWTAVCFFASLWLAALAGAIMLITAFRLYGRA